MSKFRLDGKVAIVTGGAGGIGTSIATEYVGAGARVVIASRNQENLDKVAAELNASGAECLAVATDVCDEAQVRNLVDRTVEKFGRLDIMVNNAGGALHSKPPHVLTYEEWNAGIALNLSSVFLCSKVAGEVMVPQKSGSIINVSSVAGIKAASTFVHYGAAKAGVLNLTKSFAKSWGAHNITVNCIAPGLTATPGILKSGMMPPDTAADGTPLGRLQHPFGAEHVANIAVFLASDAASHLTGEIIPIRSLVDFDR